MTCAAAQGLDSLLPRASPIIGGVTVSTCLVRLELRAEVPGPRKSFRELS